MARVVVKSERPGAAPSPGLSKVVNRVLAALDSEELADEVAKGLRVTIESGTQVTTSKASEETEALIHKTIPIFKTTEERFVLGIVLEPTKELAQPDSQGDVYSAQEVREAAYKFMEEFQTIGLQHRDDISERVKILLNWITLEPTTINGQAVAAGTWLLGVRVQDDDLWAAVKAGDITGFSIGGTANRVPIE